MLHLKACFRRRLYEVATHDAGECQSLFLRDHPVTNPVAFIADQDKDRF